MSARLLDSARTILQSRTEWENKQRLYYMMRHEGLRRRVRPFPNCADLHYPEVDMAIRKLKPFWMGQVQSGDRLAQFTAMRQQLQAVTDAAADYLHFEITQNTQFLRKLRVMVDTMLLRGRGILKIWCDPFDDYKIVVENVDPLYLLVPDMAADLETADEFVHVRQLTVGQYRRDRRYPDKSEQTIRLIAGSENFENYSQIALDKRVREGITHNRSPNTILIWEHYTKTMGGWTVTTYSPQNPQIELRKPFGVPYRWRGKILLPFVGFSMEVKDEGWYSPRGLGELLAPVENYLCKLWNEKADAMTFLNRPVFTAEGEVQNSANIRWQPGEFIPRNVKSVAHPAPPFSFDEELMFARGIGEQQSQSPDFGIMTPDAQSGGSKPRTATENQRISALQQAGTNDNANFFREDLGKCYLLMWALKCQFKPRDFTYWAADKIGTLPEEALHDQYLIAPDGSPDGWNRMARFQKAAARLQMWKGDPNCDQDKLKRDVMAADDGAFALKAFVPTGARAAQEAEDEAMEIMILQQGFPASVQPGEDHATRILVDVGWLDKQAATGAALDPIAKQRVMEHLMMHWQYLKQTQPEAVKPLAQQIAQMEAARHAQQQGPQAQQQGPQAGQQGPQAGQQGPQAGQQGPQAGQQGPGAGAGVGPGGPGGPVGQ